MKKIITVILAIAAITITAQAAEDSFFGGREVTVSLLYGGNWDGPGDRNDFTEGHGVARVSYYHTPYLGGFTQARLDHDGSRAVDGGGAGLLLRYPFRRLAPYSGFSVDWSPRDTRTGHDYTAYNFRLGVEFKLSESLGLQLEALKDFNRWRMDGVDVLGGVTWKF